MALIRAGKEDEGFVEARRGVKGLIAANAFNICWFVIYADACERNARYGEAEEYLQLIKLAQDQGEMWMAAEYHRINAKLALARNESKEAVDAEFDTALKIARKQKSALFEHRITRDLAEIG